MNIFKAMQLSLAVMLCKLGRFLLRVFGFGGTSLPGKLALKICPELLVYLSAGLMVIVVSGTNGKTTTSRMIEAGMKEAGVSVLANRSGANLLHGIAAEFAANSNLCGKVNYDAAVIECDEAALRLLLRYVKPEILVVTNVFRDQLDRYGEVTTTVQKIKEAIALSTETILCLNADDSLVVSMGEGVPNPIRYYGISVPIESSELALYDAMYCIHCRRPYSYHFHTYDHLGGFYCPNCGYHRPEPQVSITDIKELSAEFSRVKLDLDNAQTIEKICLPGVYNIANALAAVTVLDAFGLNREQCCKVFSQFSGFGRMESFALGAGVKMILVKNPAGYTQVIHYLEQQQERFSLLCCLNDKYADGRDVSWIWDVPFERLANVAENVVRFYVAGTRREDMRLRLKYAGIPEEKLEIISNYNSFIDEIEKLSQPIVIVPTYTAMMELRPLIIGRSGGKDFWE